MRIGCDEPIWLSGQVVIEELRAIDAAPRLGDQGPKPCVAFTDFVFRYELAAAAHTLCYALHREVNGYQDDV